MFRIRLDKASMGSVLREWIGFQQFPTATQSKLVELFAKLKEEGVDKLTILVMGKGGVGKSSTVNSLLGERAVNVSSFQSEAFRPVMVSRNRAGFTLNIIDTPGLVEGGYVSYQALDMIKRFLLNKTIHVLLYVDRLDAYRVDDLDKQIIGAISDSFGKEIWSKSLLVLTHAQLCPPDDLSYDVFCARRSEAVLKTIRMGARIRKRDFERTEWGISEGRLSNVLNLVALIVGVGVGGHSGYKLQIKASLRVRTWFFLLPPIYLNKGRDEVPKEIENLMNIKFKSGGKKSCVMVAYVMRLTEPFPPLSALSLWKSVGKHLAIIPDSAIPVGLVENSGRCNKNENDEKILPNGDAWIPSLVKEIILVATNGKKALVVDEKLVSGSESNDRGKIFIPLILGIQWLLVKWIQREIKKDIAKGGKYL
ncbi:hypothetical protein POTOM_010657 [Populus tomentosa]|uniref:AIG1-type G domain-containing protein n=1 Tax=Populus tomentosa TaxID=118781 RepID=A0A8X8A8Y7_POPTO|nr:hypothetical protein POTOM_010657 [Populus tomentosa]